MQCCATFTFSVTYEDTDVGESCKECWCCTRCSKVCAKSCEGQKEEESEDEAAARVLGIDTALFARAEDVRKQLVIEAEALYDGGVETDSDVGSADLDNLDSEEEGS